MSWIPIFRREPDGPISVMVNTRYRDEGLFPDAARPLAMCMKVAFNTPEPHGVGDAAEVGVIDDAMDVLDPRLASELSAEYVARVRGGGYASLGVYAAPAARGRVESLVQQTFADHRVVFDHRNDPKWEVYRAFLPTLKEERPILDLHVVQVLKERGDLLTPRREVRHCAFFADQGSAQRFATDAKAQGFSTDTYQIEKATNGLPWTVCVARSDSVEHPQISEITCGLLDLAARHGGRYDGWEALLVPEKKSRLLGRLFKK